jgi:hypothetical protein
VGVALRRLAALERRAVRSSALVVTCTAADALRMRELYGGESRFEVIPHGFDEALRDLDRQRERERARAALGIAPDQCAIVFVGGPAQHNRDAVHFLERELMPRLGAWARLVIAGQCGGGPKRGRSDGGPVQRLGYVKDLKGVYAAADIAVNPVAYGSGSNVKVAEYLAAGLPIVTTPVGMRGYEHLGTRLCAVPLVEFALPWSGSGRQFRARCPRRASRHGQSSVDNFTRPMRASSPTGRPPAPLARPWRGGMSGPAGCDRRAAGNSTDPAAPPDTLRSRMQKLGIRRGSDGAA